MIILYEGNCKFFHWRGDGGVSIVSIFFVFITGVLRGYEFNFCFFRRIKDSQLSASINQKLVESGERER